MRHPGSVREVVEAGLCIGCGLCEALGPERWKMAFTPEGRLRPMAIGSPDADGDREILAACPGRVAGAPAPDADATVDPVWGAYLEMGEAWAGDPAVRHRGATGGVLTALGQFMLESGKARFVLHVAAKPDAPMRSSWVISEKPEEVLARAGSRYGPTDTLAGLEQALARDEQFVVICKPCDAGAIRARAQRDKRIDRLIAGVFVMVCGGASDLGKSQALLDEEGIEERDLTLFRYRGHGNPGPLRIETTDGRVVERSYNDVWADEAGWRIQTRCKLCPDAIGEAADIAAADIWPGGCPEGEDEGFNGAIVRTARGQEIFQEAVAAGALVRGRAHTPRDYDDFQPHQVRKKHAIAARLRGLAAAGHPTYEHSGLRIDELDARSPEDERGAFERARPGRFSEHMPRERDDG